MYRAISVQWDSQGTGEVPIFHSNVKGTVDLMLHYNIKKNTNFSIIHPTLSSLKYLRLNIRI